MSVRKLYRVIVNGEVVHCGSYASSMAVYQAFLQYAAVASDTVSYDVVMAFQPVKTDVKGGF